MTFILAHVEQSAASLVVGGRIYRPGLGYVDGPHQLHRLTDGWAVGSGVVRWVGAAVAAIRDIPLKNLPAVVAAIRDVGKTLVPELARDPVLTTALEAVGGDVGALVLVYRTSGGYRGVVVDAGGNSVPIGSGRIFVSTPRGPDPDATRAHWNALARLAWRERVAQTIQWAASENPVGMNTACAAVRLAPAGDDYVGAMRVGGLTVKGAMP